LTFSTDLFHKVNIKLKITEPCRAPDVAVHVVQPKPIRLVRAHLACALQVRTLAGPAIGMVAVEVGLRGREGIAEMESLIRRSPTSTTVLPLGLRWQAIFSPRFALF